MLNNVTLIGRIGKTPELKTSSNGSSFCNFPLATDRSYTSGDKKVKETEWHNIVSFGKFLLPIVV